MTLGLVHKSIRICNTLINVKKYHEHTVFSKESYWVLQVWRTVVFKMNEDHR